MIDRKFIWPLEGPCRDREAVAREIDGLSLPEAQRACLRALLAIIWPDNAPADWRPGDDGQEIALDTIAKHMGCSLNSARPKVDILQASGWIQTREQRGAPKRISISWGKFFELRTAGRSFGEPLHTPPTPPDPSNSNASTFGGVGGVGDLQFGGVDPSFLEGLEGYSPTPWRGTNTPDNYEPPSANDIKTLTQALNRLATAIETQNARTETTTTETTPTPPTLEASNPSNPSKIDPYINIKEIYKYGERDGGGEDTQEPPAMLGDFTWDRDTYPFTADQLRENAFVEKLFAQATARGGWPNTPDGRVQLYTLVCYALQKDKTKEGPCRIVTSGVQQRRFGEKLWGFKDSRQRATQRIGRNHHADTLQPRPPPTTPAGSSPRQTAPANRHQNDTPELNAAVDRLTAPQLREMLPQFHREYFDRVTERGEDPKQCKLLRDAWRRCLAGQPQQPASLGSLITAHSRPAPVSGLELSGLDLGDFR